LWRIFGSHFYKLLFLSQFQEMQACRAETSVDELAGQVGGIKVSSGAYFPSATEENKTKGLIRKAERYAQQAKVLWSAGSYDK